MLKQIIVKDSNDNLKVSCLIEDSQSFYKVLQNNSLLAIYLNQLQSIYIAIDSTDSIEII